MIVPRTSDGRVIFAIPWQGHVLVGTTDTPLASTPLEPTPRRDEIEFLLKTVSEYLERRPTWGDIRSTFAGIRPLVRSGDAKSAAKLARDHEIRVSDAGLVSILGGKWTIYRKMAEDCVDHAAQVGGLPAAPCLTAKISISDADVRASDRLVRMYGSAASDVQRFLESQSGFSERLDGRFPYVAGEVVWAARHEMARTLEDILARRLRMLFIDAEAAMAAAPLVVRILAQELGREATWQQRQLEEFGTVARGYRVQSVV
jgi:glycerol-3-phosphate dehydrogenase